jgi:hypothetical protein
VNKHRAAKILAECTVDGDAAAAKRAGTDRRRIGEWRKALSTDPELNALFTGYVLALDGQWRREIEAVAKQAARDLQELQTITHRLVLEAVAHPETHTADGEDPPSIVERVRMAQESMREVRKTMEQAAEMLTHYAAIVGEQDTGDPSSEASPFGAGPRGSEALEGRPPTEH